MKSWVESSKVIAATGALAIAVLALVASICDWSAETVGLAGGIVAGVLGLWRAVVGSIRRTRRKGDVVVMLAIAVVLGLSSCTATARRAIALTAIASTADAARCVLNCGDTECRDGCAVYYGAAMARDFLSHMLLAVEVGAEVVEIPVPPALMEAVDTSGGGSD